MINIVNSNQGKVQIRKKTQLKTDIDPASCEQLQTVFILCWQSSIQASCERGLNSVCHRNNRHRMRAPIFSQSKICLHKMAHSKGHFYLVQTPAVKNFARSRGVRLFFSNTVFLKSLKTRLN